MGLNLQIIWHFIINIYLLWTCVPIILLGVLRWCARKAECVISAHSGFLSATLLYFLNSCYGLCVKSQSHHAYVSPHHPAFLGYSRPFFRIQFKHVLVLFHAKSWWSGSSSSVFSLFLRHGEVTALVSFVLLSPLVGLCSSRSSVVWRQGACLFHFCIFQSRH